MTGLANEGQVRFPEQRPLLPQVGRRECYRGSVTPMRLRGHSLRTPVQVRPSPGSLTRVILPGPAYLAGDEPSEAQPRAKRRGAELGWMEAVPV